jgi:hypothetical protein
MWPWEHLAVGYLLYSAYARVRTTGRLDDRRVLLLAVCTQLPDLIDKPLAWTFGMVSDGTAVGHSIFVVGPLLVAGLYLENDRLSTSYVPAIAIGVGSHLLADTVYPVLAGEGPIAPSVLLWPLVTTSDPASAGLIATFFRFFTDFVEFLGTPLGLLYVLLEMALVGLAVVVWVRDGTPGVRPVLRPLKRVVPTKLTRN